MTEIEYGYCHCGCGRKTNLVTKTWKRKGLREGEPYIFIHGHSHRKDIIASFKSFFQEEEGDKCWLWTGGKNQGGYGTLRSHLAHRFSYKLEYGEFDESLDVLHRCDVRACVRPSHLFLGTDLDNNRDMWAKGRAKVSPPYGENHYNARLTENDVRNIRKLRASGIMPADIARQCPHITKGCIIGVLKGVTWKHVK